MDRFTDPIPKHPELAALQARYEDMARRYDELCRKCLSMPKIDQGVCAEMAYLQSQLQAMPPGVMGVAVSLPLARTPARWPGVSVNRSSRGLHASHQ